MSEGEDSGDKQYEPTQKRLDDARRKGEIPRSADLTTAAAYAGFLIGALAMGPAALKGLGQALSVPLDQAAALAAVVFAGSQAPLLGGLAGRAAGTVWPFFALPAALALLCVIAQRSLVFAPTKLEPKLNRISPISGVKNKFGRAGLFEFAKSFAKLLLYSVVLGLYLSRQLPRILGTMTLSPGQIAAELGRLCLGLLWIVVLIALALGAVDFLFQRAEHMRKHRMSRKELTDETKDAEGDPHMKQQRRQKGIQIAMNQMLADVQTADVVVVNPTHYAVALRWDQAAGRAPHVVAKGVDAIAARIREAATEAGVPIHSDPPTARALHAELEIGDEIERRHFRAVAAAIRFAEKLRKAAGGAP
ncbi:EscU/YscU/HrcU family type III secretion system export apparatus switch protein [Pseudoroseicyclus aestuarii]|uniref:Flagellar biosynthetic protein FlhB n=1 Tax=Pseudoroseicyclus aestuarii TaxID=1795041 RepID=A0A318SXN3_9RHOB|nr:flagellar type III secretion system protein FlhB [Pseudoroseicyclus aestuarii]PYE84587.1 flagellar biosynthetic protein FlhB [Pseudoroseicyclus aestuarii]